MKKIVNPCLCEVYGAAPARAFAKIEYDGKRLSICGVVGPMSNGNCKGSAGQCVDSFREGRPIEDWTPDMLKKLCDIWERWHMNDMRAACEHQRELRWAEQATEEITLYHYSLTREASAAKKAAENAAIEALRNGKPFTPTEEQTFFASLPYGLDIYETPPEKLAPHYVRVQVRYIVAYGGGPAGGHRLAVRPSRHEGQARLGVRGWRYVQAGNQDRRCCFPG